jgi:hypothetical protein
MRVIVAVFDAQRPCMCMQNRRRLKHCADIVAKTTLFPPYFLD